MKNLVFTLSILISFGISFGKEYIKVNPEFEKNFNIKVLTVKKQVISDVEEFPAIVSEDPKNTYVISSIVDGVLDRLYIKKGSFVKKGQIVATILSPEINQLKSQIEIAKVKVETTKNILKRDEMLYKEEIIPFSKYYSSKIEYENAVANLRALEKTLKSYGDIQDNKLILRAKESGVVLDVFVLAGSPVGIGKEIAKISNISTVLVKAQVPPEKVESIKVGSKAFIKTSTNYEVTGEVSLVDYQLDPATRRNQIHIVAKNQNFILKPNMFVNVKFITDQEFGIIVPNSAVISKDGKNFVVVKEGDKYILKQINITKKLNDYYVVSEGLKERDSIVISGLNLLEREFFGGK
ncbi:MAG: efflux RND transporter periplasmic adaptor subunit [Hydrogenothermaceae bacterium]